MSDAYVEFRRSLLLEQYGQRVPEHKLRRPLGEPCTPLAVQLDQLQDERLEAAYLATVHQIGVA